MWFRSKVWRNRIHKKKLCDFTDSGECAAIVPAACICDKPGYRKARDLEELDGQEETESSVSSQQKEG